MQNAIESMKSQKSLRLMSYKHYLARLHRKTLCYSKSLTMLKYSIRLLTHYLRFNTVPVSA